MNTYTKRGLAAIGAVFALGGSLALGFVMSPVAPAGSHHAIAAPAEDSPEFDCRADGNRICGPDNASGAAAGCYADSGALVAPWPCYVVANTDGSADVYR